MIDKIFFLFWASVGQHLKAKEPIKKFRDMPYERITFEEIEKRCLALIDELRTAKSAEASMAAVRGLYALQADMTPMDLCYVRHDMSINDAFYAAEQDYYDETGPSITELFTAFDELLLESPSPRRRQSLSTPALSGPKARPRGGLGPG